MTLARLLTHLFGNRDTDEGRYQEEYKEVELLNF